ncbi:MAG: alkyl hydroperoxide reductase/Thiol specific antioxidant/Mal allergen [Verrucomicrobiales bacterium]|nr:alkyl hydroperoxide reductase/Thiol specific antioxidant/Mal allergen [Verrucomicrobiales bacterium]MDB6129180.1 alkyl hydroperoxide reductase/Thiol specific antioxidant/Mal allergen [Verrucomicrobiales bacterium]
MKRALVCWLLLLSLVTPLLAEDVKTLELGDKAPDFRLPGVDGKTYSLKDFEKSKYLVILFTCVHCPTAQLYDDRFKKLVTEYGSKNFAFMAISPNDPKSVRFDELGYTDLSDSFPEMKIRAKYKEFNYPFLYDGETEETSRKYGPVATPHVFVFDEKRELRYVGRIDDSERENLVKTHDLKDALEALSQGREIAVKKTKTFGCSVKWAGKEDAVKTYMDKLAAEPVKVEMIDGDGLKKLYANDSGKLRLINVWATWCGSCVTEFPELVTINRMFRHRAFEFVSVSANHPDEQKEVMAFLKRQQSSGKNYLFGNDDTYKLLDDLDKKSTGALPLNILVSAKGEVLYRQEGEVDALALKRAIVKALGEDRFKN